MVHDRKEFPPAAGPQLQPLKQNSCASVSSSVQDSGSQSISTTYHFILCEQIVKEVIISERGVRDGVGCSAWRSNNTPFPATSTSTNPLQRAASSGTLPNPSSTSSSESSGLPPPLSTTLLTPEYIKKFQNKKLTKHLAWKDERKALTLDSETAKELQNQLAAFRQQKERSQQPSLTGTSTIKRSGSAFELERLIEAFNQEQHALVMSSLHQGLMPKERPVGIDNPALDVGGPRSNYSSVRNDHLHNHSRDQTVPTSSNHAHLNSHPSTSSTGGKMASYSFSDSSASQSLSLSSSNTDSLDTVIYKGPNAAAPSVRDWQQQRTKDSLLQQPDFGPRGEPSSYRGDSQGIFDNRSYPMQQASSSLYQPVQFNGPGGVLSGQTPSGMVNNGYSMEYRHQQPLPQQPLSVQSVHQSQQQQLHHQHSQQNGSVLMRQTNGPTGSSGIQHQQPQFNPSSQNLMLPTKSPMMTHKSLIPGPSPSSNSSNQSVPSASSSKPNLNGNCGGGDTSSVSVEKPKDSTKTFPTKTYNHIKDMISSRFGNSGGSGVQKGLNNSNIVNNNNTSTNNTPNNNTSGNNNTNTSDGNFSGMNGQHSGNSYVDSSMGISPLPSYGMNQHGQLHSHTMHDAYGVASGPQYFNGQSTMSGPQNSGNQTALNGSVNSYRSPPMNDRKNVSVNTSFRKAIHQSTLKSNLAEESLQLRPIMETNNANSSGNRDLYRSTQYPHGEPRYGLGHEPPSPSMTPHHVERAQRALDRLCEPSGPTFTRTGSGPMTHQNGIARMVQQFSGSNNTAEESGRPMYHANGKIGAMSPSSPAASQLSAGELGANRFRVTPGPSSTTSTSSGGLSAPLSSAGLNTTMTGMITAESSLSSPSSYVHNNKQTLVHQAPTASLQNGNSSSINNNSGSKSNHPTAGNNNDQAPPPLPTSQKPEVSGASGHSSTAGLSHHFLSSSGSSHHNTLGLPPALPSVLVGEKRENGDGSSGTMETSSSGNLVESSSSQGATGAGNASSSALALNKNKSEQLKKITADLHNLAISVAAEQHFQSNHHHLQFAPGSGNSGSGVGNNNQNSSSSECENKGSQRIGSGQSHTTSDSGVGTVMSMLTKSPLNSISDQENCHKVGESAQLLLGDDEHKFGDHVMDSVSSGNDSEWVDIVEPEIRQILELEKKTKPGKNSRIPAEKSAGSNPLTTSTPAHITQGHHSKVAHGNPMNSAQLGEQSLMGDITASPIPHHHRVVSGCGSPVQSPKLPKKFDLSAYNKKAIQNRSQEVLQGPSTSNAVQNGGAPSGSKVNKSPRTTAKVHRSNSGAGQRYGRTSRGDKGSKNAVANRLIKDLGLKGIKLSRHAASQILYPQDDNGDVTSTTTGLDLESMLDGQTEQTSDDDDDMSTTIDTTDAHAIRRQLESLESMYTEVLKVLGAKRFSGNRYPTSDLRNAKRRPYGSMSSLPSSVSSRPFRERKLKLDDKKKVKDIKSINKRFQRLESHVVTLARSVAHLSSEMRTQHLMVQEIESIRNEMQQLRNQVLKSSMQNQSVAAAAAAAQNFARVASGRNGAGVNFTTTDWTSFRNALPSLTNPCRVRKLTKFFGDEPPLVRIFLKKLGYEKYASAFEQERIGIMELPYLTEERLNKMGIPMGPRLRILQEAQLCLKPGIHHNNDSHHAHQQTTNYGPGNLSVYVV